MHITSSMTWNKHVSEITSKALKCIFILIHARKFRFTIQTTLVLFTWYIRTTLEYAAPVWHPGLSNLQHQQIGRVQKRYVRIILGTQYTGYPEALQRLNKSTSPPCRTDVNRCASASGAQSCVTPGTETCCLQRWDRSTAGTPGGKTG